MSDGNGRRPGGPWAEVAAGARWLGELTRIGHRPSRPHGAANGDQRAPVEGSPRLLIVDDERPARTALARELVAHGFEVTTADSGERAVRCCGRQAYDVVLLDARMPGIDGVEALRRIRRERPQARVILMSGYSVDELGAMARREGADACLRKPVDVARLIRLIERPA